MRFGVLLACSLFLPACSNNLVPRIDMPHFGPSATPLRAAMSAPAAAALDGDAEDGLGDEPAALDEIIETGRATWYGNRFHGRRTASGERFDMRAMSAAHPSLPLGSRVLVTNLESGLSVRVRINDRCPGRDGTVIDLSSAAAAAIGIDDEGWARVAIIPIET